jgi:predicted TIM-barrel enzyme
MYALGIRCCEVQLFLSKSRRWTEDKTKARWYAYIAYAMDKKRELSEGGISAVIVRANRDTNFCKAGGQKARP